MTKNCYNSNAPKSKVCYYLIFILETYFLGKNDFLGGNDLNISDLIATATLEQSILTGYERSSAIQEYLNRCSEKIPQYHEILSDLKVAPDMVRQLEAKLDQ